MLVTFIFVVTLWLFSLCVHEWSHAYVAYVGGDKSVKAKGYLSFNLFRYLDPVTSFIIPLVIVLLGGIGLPGAAVYINTSAIPKRIMRSAMSLAGPLSNALLAVLFALVLQIPSVGASTLAPALALVVLLQVSATIINLLPVPGLDGFGVLEPYLPRAAQQFARLHANKIILLVLFVLIVPSPLSRALFGSIYLVSAQLVDNASLIQQGWAEFRFWK